MSFFAELPAPPPPPRPRPRSRTPERIGPPDNVVPGMVGLSVVVGRTADTAVFITGMAAYPTGVTLTVQVMTRLGAEPEAGMAGIAGIARGWSADVRTNVANSFGSGPYDMVGAVPLGVKFADGSSASSIRWQAMPGRIGESDGPRLVRHGGSSNGRRSSQQYWLWPLPPPGPITFVTVYPDRGLAETEVSIDADVIRRAAAQAIVLWPTGPVLPPAGEPPADPAAAAAEITAAYVRAFTGGQSDPDTALEAAQGGDALRPTIESVRQRFPEVVRTSRPTVGEVVFLAPGRAAVAFSLSYRGAANFEEQVGYAVLVDGVWKVARETYCMVMGWAGAPCPPAD